MLISLFGLENEYLLFTHSIISRNIHQNMQRAVFVICDSNKKETQITGLLLVCLTLLKFEQGIRLLFFAASEIASKSRPLFPSETEALLLGLACAPVHRESIFFYYSIYSAGYTN